MVEKEQIETEVDDLMSEISLPQVDYSERQQLMDMLNRREKDREELALDQCFQELTSKTSGVSAKQMDNMANEELSVMREMRSEIDNESNMSGSQSSFYKPNLFKPTSTPKTK